MTSNHGSATRQQVETLWTGFDPVAALGGIAVPVLTLCLLAGLWNQLETRAAQRRAVAASRIPPPVKLDAASFARGQQLFAMACTACHGAEGKGVAGLGKDLVTSRFSRGLSDTQLAAFIIAGRGVDDPQNTTRIPMPPRGGRADFSDQNIADVVTFLRGLTAPRRVPDGPLPAVTVVLATPPAAPAGVSAVATSAATPAPAVSRVAPTVSTSAAGVTGALDPQAVARGKRAFISCMACHGKDATGVKNMGKDLVNSPFVAGLSNAALVDFIKKGRGPTDPANTTKIAMPPKGGNPALKDEQISDIVAYIRSLKSPAAPTGSPAPTASSAAAASPGPVAATPTAPAAASSPVKATVALSSDAVARGKRSFVSCMACHGKDATGVKNMGKNLVSSPFVADLTDQALVDFIKKGRGPTDPGNTTKIAMPPKGGNPALKDEQIQDIVAYLRSLRQSARTE